VASGKEEIIKPICEHGEFQFGKELLGRKLKLNMRGTFSSPMIPAL
jgi:hypothetical protein